MKPKGTVFIIGGAEDKGEKADGLNMRGNNKEFEHFEILKELLPVKNGKKKIEIITTASSEADEMKTTYKAAFKKIGYRDIGFMNIQDKSQARTDEVCKRIHNSHAVLLTGGDQFKLSTILGGTPCVEAIKQKYIDDKDFVIAGTSAGAMAMTKIMIYEGGVEEALLKKDLRITSGLGIYETCIVDTHFIKRGRFGRLAQAIIMNPELLGIGLGEDTVLIIKKGNDAECRGSGMIVMIDGSQINQTNITETDNESPIYVENLKVDLLAKGTKFSIKERKIIPQGKARHHAISV
jgi:cyanophycinase